MNDDLREAVGGDTLPPAPPQPRRRLAEHGSVPRNIGRIEPWIGGALALYTAWITVSAYGGRWTLWLFVLFAAAVAFWSWKRPSRRPGELVGRALALAALGFGILLQASDDPMGAGGYFFYWVSLPPIFYSFLLRSRYALIVVGANLAAYALAIVADGVPADADAFIMRAGLLAIFGGAAIRMGHHLRRTDEVLESRRIDLESGLLNEYGFLDHGGDLWRECRKNGEPIAMGFVEVPELRRLRVRKGAAAARAAMGRVAETLAVLDTGRNVVARLGMLRFAVLAPAIDRDGMEHLLAGALGSPPRVEVAEESLDLALSPTTWVVDSHLQGIPFRNFFETERGVFESWMAEREALNRQMAANDLRASTTGGGVGGDSIGGPDAQRAGPITVPVELKA